VVLESIKDFISLFYPEVCLCCGESLAAQEEFVCTMCIFKLPKTNFHTQTDNTLSKVFAGRAEVNAAAAWCYYQKGNSVQDLVHELKYKGKKELGISIGKWYGHDLKQSASYEKIEVVVPVPLHKKKLKRRGYNQSAYFAKGLAESMKIVCLEDGLMRTIDTETQTRKSRYSRWENVKDIFSANKVEELRGKHVLLVDDIITTGATIEACVHTLKAIPVASVSIASIGYTEVA
jgi:ComF family protein